MAGKRRFFVETFGCQMNVNDSEKVTGLLLAAGLEPADTPETADCVFINTCAVRQKAAQKLDHTLGRLRRLKEQRPELKIAVGGCVAQLDRAGILQRAPHVDVLVGTRSFIRVPELLAKARAEPGVQVDLDRREDTLSIPPALVAHTNPVRAYVTAMEGCNHVCSFCVVPRARGPEICRSPEAIVEEVEAVVARGFPEVMLLGQTVNAYRHGNTDFSGLLHRVNAVRGLRRLRFTTSHPSHVGERMAEALRNLDRACPYLHLPVQSGSDRLLERMRRGHSRAEYMGRVELLRSRVPDLALSSDVIVGYPEERQEDFHATLELLDEVGFDSLFVFEYSPRPGTLAARQPDDVPKEEKRRRLIALNERQQAAQKRRHLSLVGRRQSVLVESAKSDGRVAGRTPHFRIVHFDGPASLVGRLVEVEIVGAGANSLLGALTSANGSLTGSSAVPIL